MATKLCVRCGRPMDANAAEEKCQVCLICNACKGDGIQHVALPSPCMWYPKTIEGLEKELETEISPSRIKTMQDMLDIRLKLEQTRLQSKQIVVSIGSKRIQAFAALVSAGVLFWMVWMYFHPNHS